MPLRRASLLLPLLLCACAPPAGSDSATPIPGTLEFTDTNVVPISGGYTAAAVAVATSADLCFDTSALGETVGAIAVWGVGMGDGGLRCALGRDSLTQVNIVGGLYTQQATSGRTCLSEMDLHWKDPFLTCEEGLGWMVSVSGADGRVLAYRILDPCGADGASEVVIDSSEPSFTPVIADVGAAEALVVQAGGHYTLDWAGVSVDAFGAAVDPVALWNVVVAELSSDVDLAAAILSPETSAEAVYELAGHTPDNYRDLDEPDGGTSFPGFEVDRTYLIGFSPPSDCVLASVIAVVNVGG